MILDRSLTIRSENVIYYCDLKDMAQSRMIILERLADEGCFQNNRRMFVKSVRPFIARLFQVIRPMNNLEKLHLLECKLTLIEDIRQLFRSCPKLTGLRVRLFDPNRVERERFKQMNEELKNELRSGFQRLFELHWIIDSCPVIQEIFT